MIRGKPVGKEEGAVEGILGSWVQSIECKDDTDDDERIRPSVSKGEVFPAAVVRSGSSSFGVQSGGFAVGGALSGSGVSGPYGKRRESWSHLQESGAATQRLEWAQGSRGQLLYCLLEALRQDCWIFGADAACSMVMGLWWYTHVILYRSHHEWSGGRECWIMVWSGMTVVCFGAGIGSPAQTAEVIPATEIE